MNWISAIAVAILISAVSPAKAEDPFSVEMVNQIEMPKEEIYDNTLLWMAETFVSSEAVIDLKDRELGVIIGNAVGETERTWLGSTTFRFKLKVEVRDNRYRVSFNNVLLMTDGVGKPIEQANFKMLEPKARELFAQIDTNLREYLESAKGQDDW